MRNITPTTGTLIRSPSPSFRLAIYLWAWVCIYWPTAIEASHGREEINYIAPDRIKALIDGGEKVFFLDIRPPKEFQEKHVNGARSIPLPELEKRLNEVPKAGRIIVYCNCKPGAEDADAYFLLRDNGFRNVAVMEEGFSGWLKRKFPVEANRR